MRHPIHPRRPATGLTPYDALAATLLTLALVMIVIGMIGCSWHVAIDTWEGTASSDMDCHLSPAKASTPSTNNRPPRPAPTTTPVIPPPPTAK